MAEKPDSELVLRCREVHDVAREVENLVSSELQAAATDATIYVFKSRLKTPGKVLSKVLRKRRELLEKGSTETYEPDQVTDVFACRFVTLFQEQIPEIVRILFERLDRWNETKPVSSFES
jgi:ppGpp synthetase/RelA/SpoT-type nucleotidyltranferase